MTIVKHKRGTGIPSPDDIEVGEIAIDTSVGTAYTKAGDGRVVPIGGDSGPSTHVGPDAPDPVAEGQLWLNTDDGYMYVYYDNSGNPTWMSVERES
jgi:hypothetical protein